ncbi:MULTISPECIES: DUF1428 family protein [Mycetohabitans]|nr:DUF1428 family protein [Mycetohabitans sp. B3]MCF2133809.1 DUF1428 domain-containing protein [Mycetohabitans sp. B3]
MGYIDGFIVLVPRANCEAYIRHARAAATVFKKHGTLELVE